MKNISWVIFDMDGVITDSEPAHVAAEQAVFDKYKIQVEPSDWETFKGKTPKAIFTYVIEKYSLKDLTAEKMASDKIDFYLELAKEKVRLFDEFINLAEYLKKKYRLALTTSSPKQIQQAVFSKFGLSSYFEVVVTGDMVQRGKPDPEPYLMTLSAIGCKPEEAVVIEDSHNGIASGQKAGIRTIGVTHTFPREKLKDATIVVDSLLEIKNFL